MQKMHQQYQDIAEFRIVYINEAHAADGTWPVSYAKDKGIFEHQDYGQRCSVAQKMLSDENLSIPCIIDKMDNKVNEAYKAHPDRVFVVRKDGRLAVAGKRGPFGFKPAIAQTKTWLAHYKKTGEELENIPEPKSEEGAAGRASVSKSAGGQEIKTLQPSAVASIVGHWEMKTTFGSNTIEATMSISVKDGKLTGRWSSMGREMALNGLRFDGGKLSFVRNTGGDQTMAYTGTVKGDKITGKYSGPFGELKSGGVRTGASPDDSSAALLDGTEKSFVVVGYSTSYAWPAMLQDMLDDHAGRHLYHVLNAVVGGSPVETWMADPGSKEYQSTMGTMLRDYFGSTPALRGSAPHPTIALCQQSLQFTRTQKGPVKSANDTEGIRIGADALEKLAERLKEHGVEKVYLAMHIYKEGYEPEVGNERLALKALLTRGHDFIFEGPDVWSLTIAEHPAAFTEDRLHPNERGMKIMAEGWYRTIAGADARRDIIDDMHARSYPVEDMMRDYLDTRRTAAATAATQPAATQRPTPPKLSSQQRRQRIGELTQDLIAAASGGDDHKALEIALQSLDQANALKKEIVGQADQAVALTNYNVACIYSRMKQSDKAFEHLNEAIETNSFPGDLVTQMEGDSDLDNIRSDPRYKKALEKAKIADGGAQSDEAYRGLLGLGSDKYKVIDGMSRGL